MANFVLVKGLDGILEAFINIDQISLITDIGPSGCKLRFARDFEVDIKGGENALQFMRLLTPYVVSGERAGRLADSPAAQK